MNSPDASVVFLRDYLDKLKGEIISVESVYNIWRHIQDRKVDRLRELNIAPAFFQTTLHSMLTTLIISLARLYEPPRRSDRNLFHFLDCVQQNISCFFKEAFQARRNLSIDHWLLRQRLEFTPMTVEADRAEIQSMDGVLKNLFTWRDKSFGHFDEEYFHNQSLLKTDAPIQFGELQSLIDLAKKIINRYSVGLDGTSFVFGPLNQFDVDKILEILHRYDASEK